MDYSKYIFNHPVAGKSEADRKKIVIRWSKRISEKKRLGFIEKLGLELIQLRSSSGEPLKLLNVNNTEAIWWVKNIVNRNIPDDVLRTLDNAKIVEWIAPVFKGERSHKGYEGSFTINPTRLYLKTPVAIAELLSQIKGSGQQVLVDKIRSTRLRGLLVLSIQDVSLTGYRGAIHLAQALAEISEKSKQKYDVRFESIPLVSPTCNCKPIFSEFIPDDPYFNREWGMRQVNAPYAWSVTCGNPKTVVAVIDEGVELNHPDLSVHSQSWNATDDIDDGSPVGDHGTACAGIVAARINNAVGVAGVAGNCQVMAIATSTWADVDVVEGLYFAVDNGAHVVSMSFGVHPSWGVWDLGLIKEALQYAYDRGLLLVAASGNENISESRFPGSDTHTICVGGSNREDLRKSIGDASSENWWGACYGNDLDVVAPCIEIPTTDRLGANGYTLADYRMDFYGTSAATPLVAGLAALILSIQPSLSNEKIREIIERTCDKISPSIYSYSQVSHKPNSTWNDEVGYGRINVERAIQLTCQLQEEAKAIDLLKDIHWRRHRHAVAITRAERKSLVPLLRQSALDRIPVGIGPVGMAFDGAHVWVANRGSNNVSKIDIVTNRVVATIRVGDHPWGLVFDGAHVWVANSNSNNVSKIDIVADTVKATINVGEGPRGLAFDGNHVWVANQVSNTVSKIDILTDSVVATTGLGMYSIEPEELVFDGKHIWVSHRTTAPGYRPNFSKIDCLTNLLVASIKVGRDPCQLAFDGTHLWVANYFEDTVSKINVETNQIVASIGVGLRPYGVVFDGAHIWVGNHHGHTLSKIDVNSNEIVKTIGAGLNPAGITFDGTHIWVANHILGRYLPTHHVSKIPALPLGVEPPSSAINGEP